MPPKRSKPASKTTRPRKTKAVESSADATASGSGSKSKKARIHAPGPGSDSGSDSGPGAGEIGTSIGKAAGGMARGTNDGALIRYLTDASWLKALAPEFDQKYFKKIEDQLQKDYDSDKQIFPPQDLIFNAFNLTPLNVVKVVILGQDPYHDDHQAHGLSFSVPPGIKIPPSLKNIYKELSADIPGFAAPDHGCLIRWAEQGVFLLNATLTVQAHIPNSHSKYGWQTFTDRVIQVLSQEGNPGIVFILWGKFAHKKAALIDSARHTVIKTAHPSPLSFNKFTGCKCFSQTNDALLKNGRGAVNWKAV